MTYTGVEKGCLGVVGVLLIAAAVSAAHFQDAVDSIEQRRQIGANLADSIVAAARQAATDRERPEAAAKAEDAVEETVPTSNKQSAAATTRDSLRNRKSKRRPSHRLQLPDRWASGGW
jgi:hypothetical protein